MWVWICRKIGKRLSVEAFYVAVVSSNNRGDIYSDGLVVVEAENKPKLEAKGWAGACISDQLARFKQPKRVLFVDELPRNAMAKVQKKVLRERYWQVFDEAGSVAGVGT
jgi:acyl-CoA synthetase (AMP-forming)/AMP-acid ligase II